MGDTLNQSGVSRAQTNSADVNALRTEHAVIELGLQALDDAVMGGEKLDVVCDVATTVLESLVAHFAVEEQMLRDSGLGDPEEHIVAHQEFLRLLQAARTAVRQGHVEATLDIVDILNALQENISRFARPEPGQIFQQDGERRVGTIQVNWT
jgi:hemerythrin